MARSVDTIQAQIVAAIQADAILGPLLTSPSMTANWLLFTRIIASGIAIFEQLLDVFRADVETRIAQAVPETDQWLQDRILKFQYDAVTPQILQWIDFVPQYPIIDITKYLITQCAIVKDVTVPGSMIIKVSAGGSPLSSPQLLALNSFLDILIPAGPTFSVLSVPKDFAMIGADIYFDGQATQTIVDTNVQAVIVDYLANIPFNGIATLSDLAVKIKAVPGVKDVVWKQVECRAYNVVTGSARKLVNSYDLIYRDYQTFSGAIIPDTASGRDLASTLNYIIA